MGQVIDLQAWRAGTAEPYVVADDESESDVSRLEEAVEALRLAITSRPRRPGRGTSAFIENELLAIIGAVTVGSLGAAVERVERLTTRLQRASAQRGEVVIPRR
jgi:hypothetical protein